MTAPTAPSAPTAPVGPGARDAGGGPPACGPADGEVLDAVAAHGLPGSTRALPARPLPDDRWRPVLRRARATRLVGLLAAAAVDGALPVTDAQLDQLAATHTDAMALAVRLEHELGVVLDALAAAGVEVRLLKGSAVARTAYPDPSQRPFSDLDLLVRGEQLPAAVACLGELGFRREQPELRPGFDRRFGKSVTLTHDARGTAVDLHRTFVMGPLGLTIDTEALFAHPDRLEIAGREVAALSPTDRLVHACYNAAVGEVPARALALRDVAQLALADDGADRDAVVDRVAPWQGQAVVARAVTLAWQRFALADRTPLSQWAARYEPGRVEQRRLTASLAGRRYAAKALASLPVIPGVRGKAAFAAAVGLPQRAARNRSALAWWARGLRGARATVARAGEARG